MTRIPNVLTIAGSDSSGGAGIQADLKSFSANGVYGASVITALTAQNTLGVTAIHDVPTDFIAAQLDAVFSDLQVEAVKIGMLATSPIIETIAASLERWETKNVVLDPVMVTTSGDPLIADDAVETLTTALFPLVDVVTPNLHEAARLTAGKVATNQNDMEAQAGAIRAMGAKAVLIKGGHSPLESDGNESNDLFVGAEGQRVFSARRIVSENTHGTGCSLSSAIAAGLAKGNSMQEAIAEAKEWLTAAIAASDQLNVGRGSGPVHHFHKLWKQ